jgi:chromosome segregation ATPase
VSTKPALRLASSDNARTPERAALAAAIEALNSDKAAVEETEAGIRYAREEIRRARAAVEQAMEALESARAQKAEFMVSRALGNAGNLKKTIREAKIELEVAREDEAAISDAAATLNAQLKQCQGNFSHSEAKVKTCAQEVIKTDESTNAFLARFGKLEHEYLTAKAFVDGLVLLHPQNMRDVIGDTRINVVEAEAPWRAWEERLHSDPDAVRHA